MLAFMHEGGYAMWMSLILFLGTGAVAVARRGRGGERVAVVGALLTMASGLCGMSTGLYNTVAYAASLAVAEQAEILGVGIRESVHNTLFAGVLATILAIAALALPRFARRREAAA